MTDSVTVTYGMAAGLTENVDIEKSEKSVGLSLDVKNLVYVPPSDLISSFKQTKFGNWGIFKHLVPFRKAFKDDMAPLNGVTFQALPGKITAIIGPKEAEQATLLHLLSGRRKVGQYDGEVVLNGVTPGTKYNQNFAYVSCKTPYIPGLTYYDTLLYAARLRLAGAHINPETRVKEVMEILDLMSCRNRVIPEFPPTQGDAGRDLRLLSIAIEIIALPPLIIIHDPVLHLHANVAMKIFDGLHRLAGRGHIVLISFPTPNSLMSSAIDDIVVLSEGRSIFANSIENLEPYFCSKSMGFVFNKGVDPIQFAVDIAAGLERPEAQRTAPVPAILQEQFESSSYFRSVNVNGGVSIFSPELFRFFGYGYVDSPTVLFDRALTVFSRAFISKFKDLDAFRRAIGSSFMSGLVIGYLQYNQGHYGYYTMTLIGLPILNTANLTSLFFFMSSFALVQQVLNVHVICQKLQVFRYEQSTKSCSSVLFAVMTLLSEIPFVLAQSYIFGTIVFFLASLQYDLYNYRYFISILFMVACIGLVTAYLFASILKKEIAVRDTFFAATFFMVLLSGFPFQLSSIPDYMANISKINPLRWAFEALMSWKFSFYKDSYYYLRPFTFETYDHNHIFRELGNFIMIGLGVFLLSLIPMPMLLSKLKAHDGHKGRAESTDSIGGGGEFDNDKSSFRFSETVKPVIFARESSVTQKSRLSVNLSQIGEANENRGATVTVVDVTYRVPDIRSPQGYKVVLNKVNGQFDWGKLNVILGASQSGKTSLLHILAGDYSTTADLVGEVRYNRNPIDMNTPLWKRCALVDAHDEQHRDLTVGQVVTFAAKLRCATFNELKLVDENVRRTCEILHLDDLMNKKCKKLSPGERRRLSIAEELVQGPLLLFIDEVTNNLDPVDESVMLMTCRELVNQDRTVICTCSKPSAAVFKLFDTVLLLSKGRVIFHGSASFACKFFYESPYKYDFSKYTENPGDFLLSISGGLIEDTTNRNVIEASLLENYYKQSDLFNNLKSRIGKVAAAPDQKDKLDRSLTSDSIEIESANGRVAYFIDTPAFVKFIKTNIIPFFIWKKGDFSTMMLKCSVLVHREALAIMNRWELLVGSYLLHIFLGCMFGWVVGDVHDVVYNSTSFYAVGTLVLLLCNIYFVYYFFRFNLVILKEHSRGLYTNFTQWIACSWPVYFLRATNALCFGMIVYKMLNFSVKNTTYGYYQLSIMSAVIASTMMTEFVTAISPDLRGGYLAVPGLVFAQFGFSGLFIKAHSLPDWLAPWATSASIIRWVLQGNFINQFDSSSVFITLGDYSTYDAFLELFGWGGKSRWYCWRVLLIFMLVFKVLTFLGMGNAFLHQKGGRRFKNFLY